VNNFTGHDQLSSYADDFHLYESDPNLDSSGQKLTDRLKLVFERASKKKLKIKPSKSHVTLFTSWTKEVNKHPPVFIDGTLIDLNKFPKQLGITFSACWFH
jgi:hypothetical protein